MSINNALRIMHYSVYMVLDVMDC